MAVCPRLAWADEAKPIRFGAGAGLGVGFYQFSDVGPWLELRGLANIPLSARLYVNAQLALAYARNANDKWLDYNADGVDDLNTDERTLLALFPRAELGVRLSSAFALELGGFVGAAHTTLESTKCGKSTQTGAGYGLTAGPALALGETKQFAVALHADLLWVPYERCTNGSNESFELGLPFAPYRHLQDDAQLGLVARAHYLF
jgi:hypothetical protein